MDDKNKKTDELEETVSETTDEAQKASEVVEEIEGAESTVKEEAQSEKNVEETDEVSSEETPVSPSEESSETAEEVIDETKPAEDLNEKLQDKPAPVAPDNAKWFIVHTYAGHENKVARSLKQRVESMGFQERIFEILVPTRKTVKIISGKKQEVEEKIFAGYVFVQMILDEETWLLVRTTQGVTAFIGPGSKPTPIPDKEVEAILKFMHTEQPVYKTGFIDGDVVKITDGPFADFEGTITNVDQERGKVKVTLMIFGRETPVELDFLQVQKL